MLNNHRTFSDAPTHYFRRTKIVTPLIKQKKRFATTLCWYRRALPRTLKTSLVLDNNGKEQGYVNKA